MGKVDNAILDRNIKYLLKERGCEKRVLERHIGLTVGYLSRLARINKLGCLAVEKVAAMAEFFDVSLEELLFKDMLREEQIKQKSRQIEQLKQELTRLEQEQWEENK